VAKSQKPCNGYLGTTAQSRRGLIFRTLSVVAARRQHAATHGMVASFCLTFEPAAMSYTLSRWVTLWELPRNTHIGLSRYGIFRGGVFRIVLWVCRVANLRICIHKFAPSQVELLCKRVAHWNTASWETEDTPPASVNKRMRSGDLSGDLPPDSHTTVVGEQGAVGVFEKYSFCVKSCANSRQSLAAVRDVCATQSCKS